MTGFWNKKTPGLTLFLFGVICATSYFAVSVSDPFGYWPPTILLVVLVLTILNNLRIDRARRARNRSGRQPPVVLGQGAEELLVVTRKNLNSVQMAVAP